MRFLLQSKVTSLGSSETTSKNSLPIEVYVAVEVADANVLVNRSIFCHGTHSLHQEDIGVFTDTVAPCELALGSEDLNVHPSLHVLIAPLTCKVCTFHNFVEDRCRYL